MKHSLTVTPVIPFFIILYFSYHDYFTLKSGAHVLVEIFVFHEHPFQFKKLLYFYNFF